MFTDQPYLRPAYHVVLGSFAIALLSAFVYTALWYLDFGEIPGAPSPITLIQMASTADTVQNLSEVTVAVLGIAITVVAIIVELAANRYTPRITELFIKDPVNGLVLSFFSVTAVLVLLTAMSIGGVAYPKAMVTGVIIAMVLSLVMLLPYFLYVFEFLTPTSIITRIEYRGIQSIRDAARTKTANITVLRTEAQNSVEQLGDIALNSLGKKEKAIAITALNGLADLAVASMFAKEKLPLNWFTTHQLAVIDRDFVALHPSMSQAIEHRKTWYEMKILRQFQSVFGEAANDMRDCAHMVTIHTRNIAVQAAEMKQEHTMRLAVRFMNTFLRTSINKRDVRTAYNLFNEYRALAEAVMLAGEHELTEEIAERFKFYGQIAFSSALPFILEIAAYDLCTLLERAHETQSPAHEKLLTIFLDVDREPDGESGQEASLRGVRKAQVKLATYYLIKDEKELARRIFEDMRRELPDRLRGIRGELASIVEPEWWEVSDRGINFDYLEPNRREKLNDFFAWFPNL